MYKFAADLSKFPIKETLYHLFNFVYNVHRYVKDRQGGTRCETI